MHGLIVIYCIFCTKLVDIKNSFVLTSDQVLLIPDRLYQRDTAHQILFIFCR